MRFRLPSFVLAASIFAVNCGALVAAETAAPAPAPKAPKPLVRPPPPAAANPANVFSPPSQVRPLKIAIYEGPGSGAKGIASVTQRALQLPGATVTPIKAEDMGTRDLTGFDVIIFSGGSGSAQSKGIGDAGRENVRKYVENGGGYLGICAGAYLACAGFNWGLGILNAGTVSDRWQRGQGMVRMELTDSGREAFGPVQGEFTIRYANGPIIKPLKRPNLPAYQVAALFRTEMAENRTPVGAMVNSPAAAFASYGKGRVMILSPHSEDTPGLENVIPRALAWASAK